jgi:hypothetical protein
MSTSSLYVVIHKEKVRIEKEVFQLLLDCSHLITSVEYKKAVTSKEINFEELKASGYKSWRTISVIFCTNCSGKKAG